MLGRTLLPALCVLSSLATPTGASFSTGHNDDASLASQHLDKRQGITAPPGFDIAHLIMWTGLIIAGIIDKIKDADHKKEEAFTQSWVSQARREYPSQNALCFHNQDSTRNFVNEVHYHVEVKLDPAGVRTQGFECYSFDSGSFDLAGDGGFENWAFAGNCNRDGSHVDFYSLEPPPSPPPPPQDPPIIVPDPVRTTPDGVHLVNCNKGDEVSSGAAYYRDLKDDGANWGEEPDDYVDVSHGSLYLWEQSSYVTFPSTGTLFSWSIVDGGQSLKPDERAGNADNTYVHFNLYKGTGDVLYERDGWTCKSIYWGF